MTACSMGYQTLAHFLNFKEDWNVKPLGNWRNLNSLPTPFFSGLWGSSSHNFNKPSLSSCLWVKKMVYCFQWNYWHSNSCLHVLIIHWSFIYFNAQVYLFFCWTISHWVWEATIVSYAIEKEITMERNIPWNILSQENEWPFPLPSFVLIELQRMVPCLNTSTLLNI